MARRVSHGRAGGFKSPQRQIANDGIEIVSVAPITFGASASGSAIGSVGFLVAVPAATLVRTRGSVTFRLAASGASNNSIGGAMGMIVVSENAFAAGLASVPLPLDDIENDWFVYEPVTFEASATSIGANNVGSKITRQFDSRGQRKLKNGDVLAMVFELSQETSTTGTVVTATAIWRQQFKL